MKTVTYLFLLLFCQIILTYLFSGCTAVDDVLLEDMERISQISSDTEDNNSLSLRSVTIVCVDAYVDVGSYSVYKGTTCWRVGTGSGIPVGQRPPEAPPASASGPIYNPDGYPTSQGGTGFNANQNVWQFPFRGLQNSKLYGYSSNLNLKEKELLISVLELFNDANTSEDFKKIFNYLTARGTRINFKMDNTIANPAMYDLTNKEITFRYISDINLNSLIEELIHAVQDVGFYGSTMYSMRKNCEFEAKVIRDLAAHFRSIDYGDCLGTYIGSINESDSFENEYRIFIDQILTNRRFNDTYQFNDLCNRWTSYSGSYMNNFNPRVLQYLFGKIRPPKY